MSWFWRLWLHLCLSWGHLYLCAHVLWYNFRWPADRMQFYKVFLDSRIIICALWTFHGCFVHFFSTTFKFLWSTKSPLDFCGQNHAACFEAYNFWYYHLRSVTMHVQLSSHEKEKRQNRGCGVWATNHDALACPRTTADQEILMGSHIM